MYSSSSSLEAANDSLKINNCFGGAATFNPGTLSQVNEVPACSAAAGNGASSVTGIMSKG